MSFSWRDLILAWLHDPPDKALSIVDHVARARRYAEAATGMPVSESDLEPHADPLAAATERLPMPKGDVDSRRVGPEDRLCLLHPLSAARHELGDLLRVDERFVSGVIEHVVEGLPDAEGSPARFLALWRLLPQRLPALAWLPADTRAPDHTIWQHMDVTAALAAAGWGENTAFLSFSVGPVQSFIEAARTVRDLWSGSMILSWLTFQAMLPIVEQLGPQALVYPALRGVPLLDRWLREQQAIKAEELEHSADELKSPCLPNKFVAVVPWGAEGTLARELAGRCRLAAAKAWREVCERVRLQLDEQFSKHVDDGLRAEWARDWNRQVEDYFDCILAFLYCLMIVPNLA